jgi:hypothetical protein
MAESAGIAATTAAMSEASSYRVKLDRTRFLELVEEASPKRIYRRKKNHFFAFDGFVMYSQECQDSDFLDSKVVDTVELSNYQWAV